MMDAICVAAGLLLAHCGREATLSWTHSIEKIVWEEDYRRQGDGLRLTEARVRGSGAGMEPPAGAVFQGGAWHYTPEMAVLPEVQLRHSPYAAPYTLCCDGRCRPMHDWLPGLPADAVITLKSCEMGSGLNF
jgi:hypothetical protein